MAATLPPAPRTRRGPSRRSRLVALGAMVAGLLVPLSVLSAPPAAAYTDTFADNSGIATIDNSYHSAGGSPLSVTGMAGEITDVNVTLRQLTHSRPADLDVYLGNPGGGFVQIMGDSGGANPAVLANVTIDDEAASPLPGNAGTITSGSYQPINRASNVGCADSGAGGDGSWPTTLSSFDGASGANLNGTWRLYVFDDCTGESGTIGGWRLRIQTKEDSTFNWTAPVDARVGGTYNITANDSSNSTGAVSADLVEAQTDGIGPSEACTVSGTVISFNHPGTCTVRARQAATADHFASAWVTRQFTILQGQQVLAFNPAAPANVSIGDVYNANVTVNGGGAAAPTQVTFTKGGGTNPANVCTVALDGTVTFQHAGTCEVVANKAGNSDWLAANPVSAFITVNKSNQTIAFNPAGGPAQPTVGDTFDIDATASSGLPVTFGSNTPAVCSIDATTGEVTFLAPGNCSVFGTQAGNDDFNAVQTNYPNMVVRHAQVIDTSHLPQGAPTGTVKYLTLPTGPSGIAVTATEHASTTNDACDVSGTKVTFKNNGTCVIELNQAGNGSYHPAPTVLWEIQVGTFGF